MLENLVTDKLDYKKLSPEEQQKRGILGRLVGVIADSKNATRNGRKYSEKLWENVFKDPIMQERIQTNCCFGELGHPTDREETDMEKIAICMDGLPKKDSNGKLQAVFNILDTPNGRILKTLCDYGCKIGVSSRGSGEVNSNFDGTEDVDPDSYECQGFDAVIIPAVKEARLNYVTEELDKTRYNKTLRARLQESLKKATADERKVIKESLDTLGVDLQEVYSVEFTYEYDDKPGYYFGHVNVYADTEEDALKKAEEYIESDEYFKDHPREHSFRDFHIGDTKYTNTDLVEEVKDQKYYKLVEYAADSGENGMEGDDFYVYEVVPAESKEEAVKLLNPPEDDNIFVTEATKDEYEEYLEYKAERDSYPEDEYDELDINEALKQNKPLKEYTTYWFGEKEYPLNFDNGMYDPHTGQFEDGTTLDDYDEEDMGWFDIDEALNEGMMGSVADYLKKMEGKKKPQVERVYRNAHGNPNVEKAYLIWKQLYNEDGTLKDFKGESLDESIVANARNWLVDKEGKTSKEAADIINKSTPDDIVKIATKWKDKSKAVDNNEAIVEQLQTLLTRNADLESKVMELQEKLSVCYAKENLTEDKIASYKTAIKSLTQDNTKAKALVEKLNTTEEKVKDYSGRISTLESLLKNSVDAKKTLKAKLNKKSEEISSLKEQLASLNKSKEKLNEDFNGSEKERDLLKKQYEEKLENSKQLIEKYKSVAKSAVNKYINSQAVRLGVKPEEIKNKLPESYGFNDIDSICEDLKKYKISVGRLPFNTEMLRENKVKMSATPSKNDPLTGLGNIDDDVDSQLLSLAKIN